ncbi:hypothetical protein [Paenibacillus xylaniclasticus]|uniref:hypothetical protein n=1 Tax=Paenibacillus xylaniclasticus TaxID=588083 RepID=UPI000FD76249|nr:MULTISPECIES: hypothetical protein [Paenibacillus]GFN29842.1 hypothetical protein PCURB6_01020 [Paenibacillus curdlanolyticus]
MAWRTRRRRPVIKLLFVLASIILCSWLTIQGLRAASSAGRSEVAEKLVDKFYRLEQAGDYGSSWELFHTSIKEKYPKDKYIQNRAHILMQDLHTTTYGYTIGKSKEVSGFRLKEEDAEWDDVYSVEVKQSFKSLYGPIELVQTCYVVKENGEWLFLWKLE